MLIFLKLNFYYYCSNFETIFAISSESMGPSGTVEIRGNIKLSFFLLAP